MVTDRIELALDAGKWRVLETLLAERGWSRSDVTPEAVAEAVGLRQANIEAQPTLDGLYNRYDVPLPLDDEETDE